MKIIAIIIAVIITEACVYSWLLGAENSQLKAENDVLKHQLNYQKDKNKELQWYLAKMDLLLAGKTAEEIFSNKDVQKSENATADNNKINEDDDDSNVIYLD